MSETLARTPLHALHREAGARLVPFAGYEMPLVYTSILAEHRQVRAQAGLFDVSHMGEIRLRGPAARALAQRVFTNDVAGIPSGAVRYGLWCAEDGGVVDDATLYCVSEDEYLFCVNAATAAGDLAWILGVRDREGFDCQIEDETASTALLAIQGPQARALAHAVLPAETPRPRRWRFIEGSFQGDPLWLSRTGYTGEDGYEIYLPSERAPALWRALLETADGSLCPVGLAARDTLRTEMGYSLYGHELDRTINPIEADLERFVRFGTGFIGEAVLAREHREGPRRRRVGLLLEGRQVARPGSVVLNDGPIGTVTSGTFSPSIERAVAIGYVPAHYAAPGTKLGVEVRGRRLPCEVTETPFYSRKR